MFTTTRQIWLKSLKKLYLPTMFFHKKQQERLQLLGPNLIIFFHFPSNIIAKKFSYILRKHFSLSVAQISISTLAKIVLAEFPFLFNVFFSTLQKCLFNQLNNYNDCLRLSSIECRLPISVINYKRLILLVRLMSGLEFNSFSRYKLN